MLAMYMRLAAIEDQDGWRMHKTSFELLLHSGGTTLVGLHLHTAVSHGKCDNHKTTCHRFHHNLACISSDND